MMDFPKNEVQTLLAGTLKDGKLLGLTKVCGGIEPRGKLY